MPVLPASCQCNGQQGSRTSLHGLQRMPLCLLLLLLLAPAVKEARNLLLCGRGTDTACIMLLHLPLLHIPALLNLIGCLAHLGQCLASHRICSRCHREQRLQEGQHMLRLLAACQDTQTLRGKGGRGGSLI